MTPQQRWETWLDVFTAYLKAERGRNSTLARALQTNRQNTHRWFLQRHTTIPAWAAVHTNIWYAEQTTRPPGVGQTR
jgi:hypothetical protein